MADTKTNLGTGPKIESAGAVIRRFREQEGLSLSELADRVGLVKSSLSKYENDQLSLSLPVLDRIAKALNVAPLVLLLECLKNRYPALASNRPRIGVLISKLVAELAHQA